MSRPVSVREFFKSKLFRIPDYQRGYAWTKPNLVAFWEDLVNLGADRKHYFGLITLSEPGSGTYGPEAGEHWLLEDHDYRVFDVVDGQQRLTTLAIFLCSIVRLLEEKLGPGPDGELYLTDTLSVADIEGIYLYKTKPATGLRTYVFAYSQKASSDAYFRHQIMGEKNPAELSESVYTQNLANAKKFFDQQLAILFEEGGVDAISKIYSRAVKSLVINEFVVDHEFDVHLTFESMNNRGRPLSDLELLKNRLIYILSLFSDKSVDSAYRKHIYESINDCWGEVYEQLGRNKDHPLNDDEFLRAHWILYFKYSRSVGKAYSDFLLNKHFVQSRVTTQRAAEVAVEDVHPDPTDLELEEQSEVAGADDRADKVEGQLAARDLLDYVSSLKASASIWYFTHFPKENAAWSEEEQNWLVRLNRLGVGYFRPLLLSVMKNVDDSEKRVSILKAIERFIFVGFRLCRSNSNYGSSEFHRYARDLDRGTVSSDDVIKAIEARLSFAFEDGFFVDPNFGAYLERAISDGDGFYDWNGLRYFLYEHEMSLFQTSRQQKVGWEELLRPGKDQISIEHIFPQTPKDDWRAITDGKDESDLKRIRNSLGNLLLLSKSINSQFQNYSFDVKKNVVKGPDGSVVRNGYANGSHSEIEVSTEPDWGVEQIETRGLRLLNFMEERWDVRFRNDAEKLRLLVLPKE